MYNVYYDAGTRSMIDLDPSQRPGGWTISRVSVLPPHRGKGLASKLLTEVTTAADSENVILYLEPIPDASRTGLTRDQLIAFYERHGYDKEYGFTWIRLPQQKAE
jgi:GNAT superfamily N-acetyltransferase